MRSGGDAHPDYDIRGGRSSQKNVLLSPFSARSAYTAYRFDYVCCHLIHKQATKMKQLPIITEGRGLNGKDYLTTQVAAKRLYGLNNASFK